MAKHKPHGKKNKRGTKKGDKIHGTKKGKKGEAAAYMTRAQALAKLQVSLADFRRLCILKGIYPRDPKKKAAGLDKTYYHSKDILFLAHEPLLNKFFELKTFMKKFKRLMGRKEHTLASSLEERKPKYTLHHLVRERYPSFEDAVHDLDDAVSMLALFQSLSADQKRSIPADAINEATRLYQEFQLYVIRARALRKVFASVKGYYFQAEICGHSITWLAPHQFAQDMPAEVDFRVMLTFLEFYRAMVKFVNFKLYTDLGLGYPPKRHEERDDAGAEVAALEAEMREAGEAREAQNQQDEKDNAGVAADVAADFGEQSKEVLEMQRQLALTNRMKTVFNGLRVFINREVPLRPIYFVLLCGGVTEVGWERGAKAGGSSGPGSAFSVGHKQITHQIVDRPADQLEKRPGREYIQPQWIFDSFNTGCLLLIAPYAPGRAPPPHLSPFVDDQAEGYVPRQREILDQVASELTGAAAAGSTASSTATGPAKPAGAEASSTFDGYAEELRAEASGVWHSAYREEQKKEAEERLAKIQAEVEPAAAASDAAAAEVAEDEDMADDKKAAGDSVVEEKSLKAAPRPTEEEEERLRAKSLMPKKHKRLLQRIEKSAQKKKDANERLLSKRKQLDHSSSAP
mmetsp:Transcript_27048/g.46932  ORF Transcript_27048/g.46932 Transcript_27048/m.46932 type:complete len:630 (-) Transcript_27048:91-1980(-)